MKITNCLACLLMFALLVFYSSRNLFAEEDTKSNLMQLTSNLHIDGFCWHPDGQKILFGSRDWMYSVDVNDRQIKKLIPGCCPQWIEGGKRFIYFLNVGYDGNRCELWSADQNGEARLRLCQKDFFINGRPSSAALSPNGNMIAFPYSCCMADGGFEEVRLILFGVYGKLSTRILFIAPFATDLHLIGWFSNSHLAIVRDGRVLVLDLDQVEWAPTDNSHEDLNMSRDEISERFERLRISSVGVTETSYQQLIQKQKIPYNCEISQDGQWVAYVEHMEGKEPFKNKLFVRELTGEENSIMICEDVSPPRFYGLPRFAPSGVKMAFVKWRGDPRYYSGDLWLADLAEIDDKLNISPEKIVNVQRKKNDKKD